MKTLTCEPCGQDVALVRSVMLLGDSEQQFQSLQATHPDANDVPIADQSHDPLRDELCGMWIGFRSPGWCRVLKRRTIPLEWFQDED